MTDTPPEPDRVEGAPHPRDTHVLIGQQAAEAEFLDAFRGGRLHHGWLLTGPRGVGKTQLLHITAAAQGWPLLPGPALRGLPSLPDAGYGPYQALNPYRLWWAVVLIAGLSLVGHFAMRLTGARRGVFWTGLLGGLASSTAATLALARQARRQGAVAGWRTPAPAWRLPALARCSSCPRAT